MRKNICRSIIIAFVVVMLVMAVLSNKDWFINKLNIDKCIDSMSSEVKEPEKENNTESSVIESENKDIYSEISKAATGIDDVEILNIDEPFELDDVEYCFGEPKIYSKFQTEWDYDIKVEGELENQTYVVIPIRVEAKENADIYLNSIYLKFFDDSFSYLNGYEVYTSNLNKDRIKSYFECNMKKGDIITADLVFADQDDLYEQAKYIVLNINNRGAYTGNSLDDKLVKVKGL